MPENGVRVDGQRREKPASSINCRDFNSSKDDFEYWIKKFEKAVKLATNVRDDNPRELHYLYKEWLPLKLDETATSHLETIEVETEEWNAVKTKLADLLIDPHEKQKWKNRDVMIRWDGEEPLHSLATRIRRMVNKYGKRLPPDLRRDEYYTQFRNAFEWPLARIIDMTCPEGSQTIENAEDALLRYTLTKDEAQKKGGAQANNDPYKGVAFAGAQLQPDRATSIENSMAAIATQMENMSLTMRSMDDRSRGFDDRLRAIEERQRRDDARRENRQSCYGNQYGGRQGNQGSWNQGGSQGGYSQGNPSQGGYSQGNQSQGRYPQGGYSPGRDGNRRPQTQQGPSGGQTGGNGNRGPGGQQFNDQSRGRRPMRGPGHQGQRGRGNPPNRQGYRQGQGGYDNRQNQQNDVYRAIDTADEESPYATDVEEEYTDEPEPECDEGACGYSYGYGEN